jgi:hypothetical protein
MSRRTQTVKKPEFEFRGQFTNLFLGYKDGIKYTVSKPVPCRRLGRGLLYLFAASFPGAAAVSLPCDGFPLPPGEGRGEGNGHGEQRLSSSWGALVAMAVSRDHTQEVHHASGGTSPFAASTR